MSARNVRDAALKVSKALPNGAAAVTSDSIDTGVSSRGVQSYGWELLLTAPALSTAQQPDAKTLTYDILGSDNADLSAPSVTVAGVIVQTGAGGTGAAGATYRYRPTDNGPKHWGFKATGSASGNSSTACGPLEMVF